ncbi:outer membrane protein assembly factor BamA [Pseudobacteriovorax antillogorgiicola]|uniref:Outer membrane protein assembly factor BamA n=1 Tax=Pseudobacteriovorax antillogorgiicola TaxID=1513793 RepID=A0A1Y6B9B5_9BACT|nr:outer membrane protein assembly factor BamA [Pseudobacteriovorax antillogorgiicola]TCS57581.1 Beta-barrel assembly machine subunit BamA [Pseudobacteriovorax antillogorgiicola]SME99606.1 Beta-barrel assembly machine subunit BamA [Pseudobacteriovorax antillogorgiicola]
MKRLIIGLLLLLVPMSATAAEIIKKMTVRGNAKVESEAILTILQTQVGKGLSSAVVRDDILSLYDLGYFSDVRFYKDKVSGGVEVIIEVKEKPSVVEIVYIGMDELGEDDFKEKMETELFTIVDEGAITNDVRMIEKAYLEKGFYLAKASFKLVPVPDNPQQVKLEIIVDEGGKVLVGDVHILGNEYFSDSELINQFFSQPYTRSSTFSAPGSVYNDDFLKRDTEFMAYLYKDQGFAEVKVAKPVTVMDSDREFVRITFEVEEGIQYSIGSIDFAGDLLYEKDELRDWMQLKDGDLFRFSLFRKDIEMLIDRYGDKGYAFADVNPKPRFDREKKLVHLVYDIDKGEKVYFGEFTFVGNTKTRDNVIRRELEVTDGELYSGTRLNLSKRNIERLGFFEEVQTIKKRDPEKANVLNYKFRVKEKPTGQLQAALGFSPSSDSDENRFFGQGRYSEENQSGYGWKTSFTGRWNGGNNYSLELGFRNPRVNDSYWSFGVNGFTRNEVRLLTSDGVQVQESRNGVSVSVGRRIIELIRAAIAVKFTKITQDSDVFILRNFDQDGQSHSVVLSLSRNDTNNYIDPSEGSSVRLSQEITGGLLGGDRNYYETLFDGAYYFPIDFTDTYRTYFKFHSLFGFLWPMGDEQIPLFERYVLGGPENLRGYDYRSVGQKFTIIRAPGGFPSEVAYGGNKQALFQLEYFFPVIQQANIKGLLFYDTGRVYSEDEPVEFKDFSSDVGFGFRWITPVAPFRFEWAYPIVDGDLGDLEFIFYLGY